MAVLAGLGAACSSDAAREPFFTGSTANQRAIIGGSGNTAVAQSALPPAQGAGGPINLASSQGGAWSAVGGQVVTVAAGESLNTLAARYGVPPSEIARANGISSPAQVVPGRAIVIPQPVQAQVAYAPPPQTNAAPTPASAKSGGVVHVVEPGQTLYSIAQAQGVRVEDIVALNGLSSQNIRVGQRLQIPGAGGAVPMPQTASLTTAGDPPKPLGTLKVNADGTPKPAQAAPTVRVVSTDKNAGVPDLPAVPAKAVVPTDKTAALDPADPASANGTTFRWPVRGRIISGYGSKANGERNDGINLAVPEGTSIKAAEAGTVIYAGNELAGYGNLILVRHADGWVSAYAHNSEIDVKRGDNVQRGQTIAKAGMTGSVSSPQVHFELRKGAKPVNPMDYLGS
ncbi:MAG: peptidoglycan DD-metalloendopeptidase family protein [Bauldia sp.]|uniref:peptidoglycan DD-metalloendopeptidase family protein n=1 Tax=Bauldia sp. TaxID=2575872 RepID=UPI001E062038|nr:peptidoglycan DD-metalloendopeptidase family protein [Bauldia sp.]MCB1495340.1 peptidoglycan DD-metalloendopeptidase family protein [Bauldia sp.]